MVSIKKRFSPPSAFLIFVQNHFWTSEENFFIGKKYKIFIFKVSFCAKNILEFKRKSSEEEKYFSFSFVF